MTPQALAEKIQALPPEEQAEVEDFIDFLGARRTPRRAHATHASAPGELVQRIIEHREDLRRRYGDFNSLPIIRDLRENGPR